MEGTSQSSTEQQPLRASDVDLNTPVSVDRLSNLEDELLCHILSFVPTKLSVSTSILAKRWRFIWAHVPVLDFSEPDSLRWSKTTTFSRIINRVMLLHRMRSLDTLRLTYFEEDCNKFEFQTWIATAIERNVRNLELDTEIEGFVWPLPLFTCKTLVHLKLIDSTLPRFSGRISLPSLKKFWFQDVEFLVDKAIPHLLTGCPVLDEFTFERRNSYGFGVMPRVAIRRVAAYNYSRRVEIKVVKSVHIKLVDYVASHISAASMLTSLVEAKVEILRGKINNNNLQYVIEVLMILLDLLCGVKCLILSICLVPSSEIRLSKRFDNYTRLELAVDWALLVKFLESADNLEILVTRKCTSYNHVVRADLGNWTEPKQVPTCLLSCLGTVHIEEFECTESEFEMVKYILMNGRMLKRMEIHILNKRFDLQARLDATQRLALFRRGSEACELAIY